MHCYQATGDEEWLQRVLPKLEKGIGYATSDAKRWDPARGLVKRGFTIDTWDFTYRPGAGTNRRINAETPMGIMHGDNSGVFQAMNQLAWMNDRLGAHILLPTGKGCRKTLVNGQEQTFVRSRVGESQYVDFVVKPKGKADMEILFQAL